MMQVYFLSVLLNALTGFLLVFVKDDSSDLILGNKTARLVIGALTFIVGIVKLFVIVQPDLIILGDLLPAIAGITGGACILVHYYSMYTTVELKLNTFFDNLFIKGKMYTGIFCLVISFIHFLLPRATLV